MGAQQDWLAWHEPYDDPTSNLARRLVAVQRRIEDALDAMPRGPIQVISMCAGQGRDLLPVLAGHPRRGDVRARLVELDERNAQAAQRAVRAHGLEGVEVVQGDASTTSAYGGAVPADLVLVCGVFGNVPDRDVRTTVSHLPSLCAPGATVIWTRGRWAPDLTPAIRAWFRDAGFDEIGFDTEAGHLFGVGTARLAVPPRPFEPAVRLFTFQA